LNEINVDDYSDFDLQYLESPVAYEKSKRNKRGLTKTILVARSKGGSPSACPAFTSRNHLRRGGKAGS
jgi:hypothetical protein